MTDLQVVLLMTTILFAYIASRGWLVCCFWVSLALLLINGLS